MGGTSTDIGLLFKTGINQLSEFEIEWGVPVVTPVVDVRTVGAGGGSIARVDEGGLLQVGPESAGADPGPASYGRGGATPTVTDANLVLGRLDARYFLGGTLHLNADLAERALETLDLATARPIADVALDIVALANENAANAIRLLTIERGIDPREFTLIAFGGAGPLHACGIADALGITRIVIPPNPGVCSALGAALARPSVDRVWTVGYRASTAHEQSLRLAFQRTEETATRELHSDGEISVRRWLACRYAQQNYEREIIVDDLGDGFMERTASKFHEDHRRQYGYAFDGDPVECVRAKLSVFQADATVALSALGDQVSAELLGTRPVRVASGLTEVPVLQRGALHHQRSGPLLLQEATSTLYVDAAWRIEDAAGRTLLLSREKA
jgi:N-methylhydantoinase A